MQIRAPGQRTQVADAGAVEDQVGEICHAADEIDVGERVALQVEVLKLVQVRIRRQVGDEIIVRAEPDQIRQRGEKGEIRQTQCAHAQLGQPRQRR